jgi:hypothetical protein
LSELELRHAQAIVPGAQPAIIIAARLGQLLVQEAVAPLVLKRFKEIAFVRRIAVLILFPDFGRLRFVV